MNELLRGRLFNLLSESSQQVTNKEMQSAYECFMEQVKAVSQSDYSKGFRILNITRIELVFLKSLNQYGQGEKCPEICLSPKGFSSCRF